MKYLSLCSGIEAASVAWHPLGWRPFAFSEIDAFPAAVLAHHYPATPNLGDMTKFKDWPDATFDILVGGTPCQSFSVAGLRKGLHDPRGNLMLTFGAIAARYRPAWLVWENVPGVLSSNRGRDFGTFLGMLGELGYAAKRFFWSRAMKLRGENRATFRELAALWKLQRGLCALTGRRLDRFAQLDHVKPKARGGGDELANLRWVCIAANLAKRDLSDDEFFQLCADVTRRNAEQVKAAE